MTPYLLLPALQDVVICKYINSNFKLNFLNFGKTSLYPIAQNNIFYEINLYTIAKEGT